MRKLLLTATLGVACAFESFAEARPYGLSAAEATKWELTFADEFESPTIDTNKWYAGYRNGQFEYYRRVGAKHPGAYTSPECCYEISNGTLKLRVDEKRPTRPRVGSSCVSCFMTSDHRYGKDRTEATVMKKFGQKYGWFEMRCKVAKGPGLESAFWLHQVDPLHQEFTPEGQPNKAEGALEFDIFEAWGTPTNQVRAQMNVHFTDAGHYGIAEPDPDNAFHVFALEWEEGLAKFYYDGKVVKTYRGKTPQRDMFVLMALFHYRCLPDHRETELAYPRDFEVDYVRVFRRIPGTERAGKSDWYDLRDGAPNVCAGLTGVEGWPRMAFWGGPALDDWDYPGKIYKSISKYKGIAQGTYTEIRTTVRGGSRFAQYWTTDGHCLYGYPMACMGTMFDFTAEDAADPVASARQAEAIVRQCHAACPYYEILFVCGATPELVKGYLDGREPDYPRELERVAEHYRLPSVNLAKYAAAEIRAGRVAWADFALAKPTTNANACVTEAIRIFLDRIFAKCGTMPRAYVDRKLPAPLFGDVHAEGRIVPYDGGFASFGQDWLGWQRPTVAPFPHLLFSTAPGATLTFPFCGTEVGVIDEIRPDSPSLEFAIDGGAYKTLPAPSVRSNELRHVYLASGLPKAEHKLTLRVKGAGTERLGAFLVNGTVKDPAAGLDYLGKLDHLAAEMPKVDYVPPKGRHAYLPKTMKKLREGGTLRLVMLGDSICADTSNSQFEKRLMKRYPKCKIEKNLSVRGSTGCDWYAQENRVKSYVLDHKPDLLIVAGISHQPDPRDVRTVVRQVRAKSPETEILLVTPVFGRTSCPWNVNWTPTVDRSKTDDWRTILETIAREEKTAYFDMTGPLGTYIRGSKMTLGAFMRDIVHANDRGKYVLGELMCRWFEIER